MIEELIKDFEAKAKKEIEALKQEFGSVRTNRPTPQIVEDIVVDYVGQALKIKQLASIHIMPPRDIVITAWDKDAVPAIAKALEEAPMGLTANSEGNTIKLRMPPMTEERRNELVRMIKSVAEKTKIKLRGSRDETNKKIEAGFKAKTVSEDQKFSLKKKVQDITDTSNKNIEEVILKKEKELTE